MNHLALVASLTILATACDPPEQEGMACWVDRECGFLLTCVSTDPNEMGVCVKSSSAPSTPNTPSTSSPADDPSTPGDDTDTGAYR